MVPIFFFQLIFCGTATTILSGAVAERMRFVWYVLSAFILSAVLYPVMRHWMWGGFADRAQTGWLNSRGFIDFAGASVVHPTGGWAALAVIVVIGPRIGRFDRSDAPILGRNIPLPVLGLFFCESDGLDSMVAVRVTLMNKCLRYW